MSKSEHPKSSVISASQVQIAGEPLRVGVPGAAEQRTAKLQVIRDGNKVIGIEIDCQCGQRHRLKLDYE